MLLKQLLQNCNGFENLEVSGVTCDSRQVKENFVFVCIEGTDIDGHKFAADALQSGAVMLIVTKDLGFKNQIIVEDTRETYAVMCANWFGNPAKDLKIIGVTGTNGKTSVSCFLKAILDFCGYKTGLIGTIHNIIGDEVLSSKNTTPSAYEIHSMLDLMRKSECTYCVMEVSSHALDQKRVFGIEFEAAMFTNLTQDHLDYHKTMENYFAAKLKLFDQAKIGIVNFDDESCRKIIEYAKCEINTYSIKSGEATYSAKNINNRPNGVDFMFVGYNLINQIKMSTGGEFTVYNALCAVGCALSLGVKLADAAEALGKYKGVKGRAEVVPCDRDFTVIIDYAHTPDGVENILKMFGNCEKNRLIALFGCGGDRDRTKRSQMGAVAAQLSDYMIITSDNPRTEEPAKIIEDILEGVKGYETPYKVIENRVEAIKYAIKNAQKGDIIVLMGKGHETYQILSDGVIHLDEREVVAQALN